MNCKKMDCQLYKNKIDNINQINCYAWQIISLQPNFMAQRSVLKAEHKYILNDTER